MTLRTIIFEFPVRSSYIYIFFLGGGGGVGAVGLGKGCVKITLTISCLEWLICLFLSIMVEFEKVLYSPDLRMVLVFLVTKVFQKGTMFK